MAGSNTEKLEKLRRKNGEIKALIAKWKDATDPESIWMLRLLHKALDMGQTELQRASEAEETGS